MISSETINKIKELSPEQLQHILNVYCNPHAEILSQKVFGISRHKLKSLVEELLSHKLIEDVLLGDSQ